MGKALRGAADDGGGRGAAAARGVATRRRGRRLRTIGVALLALLPAFVRTVGAQGPSPGPGASSAQRFDAGRFTVVAYPQDEVLARGLLAAAQRRDTFPGLPRPRARVLIAVAPDRATFRRMVGPVAPEWGAAIAFPQSQRIVMQGRTAGSDAGDPFVTLRHEIAHLALYEAMGEIPPRWFDEGYASWSAGEWGRDELFATNLALVWGGMPGLEELDEWFHGGGRDADAAYALAHRAVAELAALDTARGLTLFFRYWREEEGRLDPAVRRAYGLTLAAFEERWQARTRRQYGLIAIFADITLASVVLLAPLVPLWVARRRRDRRRLEAMRAADAAEDVRRREEETLRVLLGEGEAEGVGDAGDGERRAT